MQSFEFESGYRLDVTEKGFCLYDTETDELLVDASSLHTYWPVELLISNTNREFYIGSNRNAKNETEFGISRRS